MFETAVVRTRAADRQYSWLTFSLAASIATVRLPDQAPKQMIPFIPTVAPPPALGTPNPTPARPRPVAATASRVPVAPIPVTAPTVIPDTITPVSNAPS